MDIPPKNENAVPIIEMIDAAINPVQTFAGSELQGVNWRVLPGTFWFVAGFFGSSRSDLLLTAAGLQRAARGRVQLFGRETFSLAEDELVAHRRRIGLVFANGGRLFNRLTVAENVALPLRYHENLNESEVEDSVRKILEATDLIPFAQKIPSAISLNWQHRAALARALILKPEILLLDKPLLGMDLRHQRWTLDFLVKLSEGASFNAGRKVTVVVTGDEIRPWKTVARQFAVLKNNQWQEIGGRAELEAFGEPPQEIWSDES